MPQFQGLCAFAIVDTMGRVLCLLRLPVLAAAVSVQVVTALLGIAFLVWQPMPKFEGVCAFAIVDTMGRVL